MLFSDLCLFYICRASLWCS